MRVKYFNRFLLAAYLLGHTVFASSVVGEMTDPPHPYSWQMPWTVLVLLGTEAWLGFMCGKEKHTDRRHPSGSAEEQRPTK